ncbi:hypothetical protein BY458DRAFT_450940 [Sporodiniella umbellata]|nr:hypothetical protein BY458DRAFT_450940 [Sporodiniella umbellata]
MSLTSSGVTATSLLPSATSIPTNGTFPNNGTLPNNGTYPTSSIVSSSITPTSTTTATTSTFSQEPILPSHWDFGGGGSSLVTNGANNTSSLWVQFVICFSVGLVFFLAFCFLRTRMPVIFAPRTNMKKHKPPELPSSYFGWILPILKIDMEEMLMKVGLDAVLMLHFLLMGIKIFGICSILGIAILIPVSTTVPVEEIALKNNETVNYMHRISISAVPNGSNRLIAYLIFAYLVTFITFFFLTQSYYNYIRLHALYMINLKRNMVSRSVIVSGIPSKERSDEDLFDYYQRLNIGPVESAYVIRSVHGLNSLIKKRANALMKLEEVYAKLWGNPCKIPGYDPDRIMDDLGMYKRLIDLTEKKNSDSSSEEEQKSSLTRRLTKKATWKKPTFIKEWVEPLQSKSTSRRPVIRTGFWGMWGEKVDAIEYYTKLFDDLDGQVIEKRKSPEMEMTNVGFVTFKYMSSAVIASQIAIRPEPFACRTKMAYEPRDVLWSTVSIRGRERLLREMVVWSITIVLIVFWFVPVVLLSSLMSINTLGYIVPGLAAKLRENAATRSFMTSFVPTIVLNIVTSVLPLIFDVLGYYQGLRSRSAIDESTFSKYFFFLIFFTLIVFTLAGTSIQTIALNFANNPASILEKLATTFPSIAPFFINYTILQGFLMMPMNLLLLGSLIIRGFFHVFLCSSPREHAENRAPWAFSYGTMYPVPLLIFVVVLEYSCISPLILLFGTIYFCFGYFVFKYQLLYVYFRPYEAAGRLWIMTVPRVIFGLVLFQLTMIGLFVVKSYYQLSIGCVPLIVLTVLFKISLDRAFLQNAQNLPLQMLQDDGKLPLAHASPANDEYEDDDDDADDEDDKHKNNTKDINNQTSSEDTAADKEVDKKKQVISNKWKSAAFSALELKKGAVDTTNNTSDASLKVTLPRHRKVVLDEDDYEAQPDRLTDYRQPPMQLNFGLLDAGLRKYGNPLMAGVLPQLWLPVKDPKQADKEGKSGEFEKRNRKPFSNDSESGGKLARNLASIMRKLDRKNSKNENRTEPKPRNLSKDTEIKNNWSTLLDNKSNLHNTPFQTDVPKSTPTSLLGSVIEEEPSDHNMNENTHPDLGMEETNNTQTDLKTGETNNTTVDQSTSNPEKETLSEKRDETYRNNSNTTPPTPRAETPYSISSSHHLISEDDETVDLPLGNRISSTPLISKKE